MEEIVFFPDWTETEVTHSAPASSQEQRTGLRKRFQKFQELPAEESKRIRNARERFKHMPPE
ncbi:DUF3106 domain-containing protein [Proteobacteria bacterium 005FR1]|nr:DUF3106 domain-containing protein [Proteobacteria bacterium 005FR1]